MASKRPSIDDYMTIPEAIRYCSVPKATFYYWMKIGELASDFLGDTKVVLKTDVNELLLALTD